MLIITVNTLIKLNFQSLNFNKMMAIKSQSVTLYHLELLSRPLYSVDRARFQFNIDIKSIWQADIMSEI